MKEPSRKIIVLMPRELVERADFWAEKLDMTRSAFIRLAVKEKTDREERAKLDATLHEGYLAMNLLRADARRSP